MKKKKARYISKDGWCIIALAIIASYFPIRLILSVVWGI